LVVTAGGEVVVLRPNTRSSVKVAKPQIFNGITGKASGFLTVCKLFIRIKMREDAVEEQIQWMHRRRMYWKIWNQGIWNMKQ